MVSLCRQSRFSSTPTRPLLSPFFSRYSLPPADRAPIHRWFTVALSSGFPPPYDHERKRGGRRRSRRTSSALPLRRRRRGPFDSQPPVERVEERLHGAQPPHEGLPSPLPRVLVDEVSRRDAAQQTRDQRVRERGGDAGEGGEAFLFPAAAAPAPASSARRRRRRLLKLDVEPKLFEGAPGPRVHESEGRRGLHDAAPDEAPAPRALRRRRRCCGGGLRERAPRQGGRRRARGCGKRQGGRLRARGCGQRGEGLLLLLLIPFVPRFHLDVLVVRGVEEDDGGGRSSCSSRRGLILLLLLLLLLLRRRRSDQRSTSRRSGGRGGHGSGGGSSARLSLRRRSRPRRRPSLLVQRGAPRPSAAPRGAAARCSAAAPSVRGLGPLRPRPLPGGLEPRSAPPEDGDVGRTEREHPAEDEGIGDGDLRGVFSVGRKREREGERVKRKGRKSTNESARESKAKEKKKLSLLSFSPCSLTLHPAGRSALRAGTGSSSKATTWREPRKDFVFFSFRIGLSFFSRFHVSRRKGSFFFRSLSSPAFLSLSLSEEKKIDSPSVSRSLSILPLTGAPE